MLAYFVKSSVNLRDRFLLAMDNNALLEMICFGITFSVFFYRCYIEMIMLSFVISTSLYFCSFESVNKYGLLIDGSVRIHSNNLEGLKRKDS